VTVEGWPGSMRALLGEVGLRLRQRARCLLTSARGREREPGVTMAIAA
jgi:hypothetical protein